MKRISIGTLLVLLAVAYMHIVPIHPAKAQSLAPTGLDKNGLSALGLENSEDACEAGREPGIGHHEYEIPTWWPAIREADRAEAEAWSIQMEGYGGPAQPPRQSVKSMPQWRAGLLEVECNRCNTRASIPLDAIWRPRATPLWKLEAALTCRSCRKGRYAPPVHMVKLTEAREITPYRWVHPDEGR